LVLPGLKGLGKLNRDQNLERFDDVIDGVAVCTEAVEVEEEGVTGKSPDGEGDIAGIWEGDSAAPEVGGRGDGGEVSDAEVDRRGAIVNYVEKLRARSRKVFLRRVRGVRCGAQRDRDCATPPRAPQRTTREEEKAAARAGSRSSTNALDPQGVAQV
jgi:hypothetical protein